MPPRSAVYGLDVATRVELDRRIAAAGYGKYADHLEWLAGKGCAISLPALQRYGKRLKDRAEADSARAGDAAAAVIARMQHTTEIARAAHGDGGDPLEMHEQAAALCMARLYEIAASEDVDAKQLQAIARSLNDTLRTIASARGQRDEEARKAAVAALPAKDKNGKPLTDPHVFAAIRAGIEGETEEQRIERRMAALARVKQDIYGIVDDPEDAPGVA